MKHELVHRLTHVGHTVPASLPGRGHLGRAGALARRVLRIAGAVTLVAAATLAGQLAAIAVGDGLAVSPLAVLAGVLVATAAAPTLAARVALGLTGRA